MAYTRAEVTPQKRLNISKLWNAQRQISSHGESSAAVTSIWTYWKTGWRARDAYSTSDRTSHLKLSAVKRATWSFPHRLPAKRTNALASKWFWDCLLVSVQCPARGALASGNVKPYSGHQVCSKHSHYWLLVNAGCHASSCFSHDSSMFMFGTAGLV